VGARAAAGLGLGAQAMLQRAPQVEPLGPWGSQLGQAGALWTRATGWTAGGPGGFPAAAGAGLPSALRQCFLSRGVTALAPSDPVSAEPCTTARWLSSLGQRRLAGTTNMRVEGSFPAGKGSCLPQLSKVLAVASGTPTGAAADQGWVQGRGRRSGVSAGRAEGAA